VASPPRWHGVPTILFVPINLIPLRDSCARTPVCLYEIAISFIKLLRERTIGLNCGKSVRLRSRTDAIERKSDEGKPRCVNNNAGEREGEGGRGRGRRGHESAIETTETYKSRVLRECAHGLIPFCLFPERRRVSNRYRRRGEMESHELFPRPRTVEIGC